MKPSLDIEYFTCLSKEMYEIVTENYQLEFTPS